MRKIQQLQGKFVLFVYFDMLIERYAKIFGFATNYHDDWTPTERLVMRIVGVVSVFSSCDFQCGNLVQENGNSAHTERTEKTSVYRLHEQQQKTTTIYAHPKPRRMCCVCAKSENAEHFLCVCIEVIVVVLNSWHFILKFVYIRVDWKFAWKMFGAKRYVCIAAAQLPRWPHIHISLCCCFRIYHSYIGVFLRQSTIHTSLFPLEFCAPTICAHAADCDIELIAGQPYIEKSVFLFRISERNFSVVFVLQFINS